jgi:DNA-binding MarR family transcriptional regulator
LETGSSDLMSLFIRLNKLRATMMYMEMKALGLTGPQLFLLRELFLEQPKTLGDLSKALELSNSTVTGIVDRLERNGLVTRTRDEKDRRVIWISTTEQCNLKTKERFQKIQTDLKAELESSFTPEQFALLRALLEKLIVHVENMLEGIT